MTATAEIPRRRFARMYLKASARAERRGATEPRRRLLEGLTGRVVEIGAGNGLNFAPYPASVTDVIAIEPEPTLRAVAAQAAVRAPVPVTVREGIADALPLADGEMDAAVASLVLCSVPDRASALTEIHRVVRPGGELRFYETPLAIEGNGGAHVDPLGKQDRARGRRNQPTRGRRGPPARARACRPRW
jgi:SAM-dependent methyltransferase